MSGNERSRGRDQKYHCSGHIHGLSKTMQACYAFDDIRAKRRVGKLFFRSRSDDEGGSNRVYIDVLRAPLHG